jgi:hypothetical protein
MLNYDKDTYKITMVRKDTGDLTVALENYLLDTGDEVVFTVNTGYDLENHLIQKRITEFQDHSALVRLGVDDTDLEPGEYLYDIQVNTADGRVDTVIGPAKFKITGGITF